MLQGLTEFLPVSSSGHLVLGGHLLGLSEPHLLFDITVHVATVTAIVVYYRQSIIGMVRQSLAAVGDFMAGASVAETRQARPEAWLLVLLVVGSVPTAMAGLLVREWAEAIFGMPRFVAGMLLVTAALLVIARLAESKGDSPRRIGIGHALLIGLVQGMAIVPGISRSGSTIAIALLLGLGREEAARFSFLLAVPAVLGALLVEIFRAGFGGGVALVPLAIGFAAAALVGLAALALFVPLVRSGRLHYFAAYLVPVGIIGWVTLP